MNSINLFSFDIQSSRTSQRQKQLFNLEYKTDFFHRGKALLFEE